MNNAPCGAALLAASAASSFVDDVSSFSCSGEPSVSPSRVRSASNRSFSKLGMKSADALDIEPDIGGRGGVSERANARDVDAQRAERADPFQGDAARHLE